MTNVQINGTLLSDMGVTLLSGAYAELMTPAPLKSYIENDDPNKDGVQIDQLLTPKKKARELTLKFLIRGSSKDEFMARYNWFVSILHSGIVTIYVADFEQYFRLLYLSVTQYGNYRLNACEMAVKFKEPDPTNRTA